jgi:hypothetical protein
MEEESAFPSFPQQGQFFECIFRFAHLFGRILAAIGKLPSATENMEGGITFIRNGTDGTASREGPDEAFNKREQKLLILRAAITTTIVL